MTITNDGISNYSIPEKRFWNRVEESIRALVFIVIILELVFIFSSKTPLRDFFATLAVFTFFGVIFFVLPQIKSIHKLSFSEEFIQINGNRINKPYEDKISVKDLKLKIYTLGRGKISGYEMVMIYDGNKYPISINNGWSTLVIYHILVEIKQKREMLKINKEDGIFKIPEIEKFLFENKKSL